MTKRVRSRAAIAPEYPGCPVARQRRRALLRRRIACILESTPPRGGDERGLPRLLQRSPSITEHAASEPKPAVSVIVPTRDDVAGMHALMSALAAQTLPADRFEVVVGDDGSKDGGIRALASADGRVRVASGPPQNSYAARNRAVAAARADVLAFCDSDCLPEPAWLERGLAAIEGCDLVGGAILLTPPDQPSPWTLLDVDLFLDQERYVQRGYAATANLFVRRATFDRVDGFDQQVGSGGDFEFVARCVRAGAVLRFGADAVVRHPTRDDARGFLRKIWRTSRAYAVRRRMQGEGITPSHVAFLVPAAMTLYRRRVSGRGLGLNSPRLRECGLRPGTLTQAQALGALYLVVHYTRAAAQLSALRERP